MAVSVSGAYFLSSTKGCWLIDGDPVWQQQQQRCRTFWRTAALMDEDGGRLSADGHINVWWLRCPGCFTSRGQRAIRPRSDSDTPPTPTAIQNTTMVVVFPPGLVTWVRTWWESPRKSTVTRWVCFCISAHITITSQVKICVIRLEILRWSQKFYDHENKRQKNHYTDYWTIERGSQKYSSNIMYYMHFQFP